MFSSFSKIIFKIFAPYYSIVIILFFCLCPVLCYSQGFCEKCEKSLAECKCEVVKENCEKCGKPLAECKCEAVEENCEKCGKPTSKCECKDIITIFNSILPFILILILILIFGVIVLKIIKRPPKLCPRCGNKMQFGICIVCGVAPPQTPSVRIKATLVDGTSKRNAGNFGEGFEAIFYSSNLGWQNNGFIKRIRFRKQHERESDYSFEFEKNRRLFQWEYGILKDLTGLKFVPQLLPFEGLSNPQKDLEGNTWCWYLMTKARGIQFFDYKEKENWNTISDIIKKKIMLYLCHSIIVLHKKNIAHRDIKPQNIFFDKETGFVTLIDFGSARRCDKTVDKNPLASDIVSSDKWCAPEQLKNELSKIDKFADVYTYGKLFKFIIDQSEITNEISDVLETRILSQIPSSRNGSLEKFYELLKSAWGINIDE